MALLSLDVRVRRYLQQTHEASPTPLGSVRLATPEDSIKCGTIGHSWSIRGENARDNFYCVFSANVA